MFTSEDLPVAPEQPYNILSYPTYSVVDPPTSGEVCTTTVDVQLTSEAFPIDVFNEWAITWLHNCGRLTGEGKSIAQIPNESLALEFFGMITDWETSHEAPVISVFFIGEAENLLLPKAVVIGTILRGGSVFCIPIGVFQSSKVRKAFFAIFSNQKIIKAMFGTCALLPFMQHWISNAASDEEFVGFEGAQSVLDTEQLFNGPRRMAPIEGTNDFIYLPPNYQKSFRRYQAFPECASLARVFSIMFRQAYVPEWAFFAEGWSNVHQWSLMSDILHKEPLIHIAMQHIDLVYLFAMCGTPAAWHSMFRPLLKIVNHAIQVNWSFPGSTKRASFFNTEVNVTEQN